MAKATETQKEIVKYLNELTNNPFGGVVVPARYARDIHDMGNLIGMPIRAGMYFDETDYMVLYLA